MPGLANEEVDELLARPNIARLATLNEDGSPTINPVWYNWDPEARVLYIIARAKSRFLGNVRRDSRVAVTVDTHDTPYRRVIIHGRAETQEDADWVTMGERMTLRYLGEEGTKYLKETINRPRVMIKIVPESVITWKGAEWHPRYL